LLLRAGSAKDGPRIDGHVDELPTATLAVRRLGSTTFSAEVVAEQKGSSLSYRFRGSPSEPSACPPVTFEIPVLMFSAEIVSMRDGRILARIDETHPILSPSQAVVGIEAIVPVENEEAVKAMRQYAEVEARGVTLIPPLTQPYWLQSDVRCKNAEAAFQKLTHQVVARVGVELETAASQVFVKALDPLFDVRVDAAQSPKAHARPIAPKPR